MSILEKHYSKTVATIRHAYLGFCANRLSPNPMLYHQFSHERTNMPFKFGVTIFFEGTHILLVAYPFTSHVYPIIAGEIFNYLFKKSQLGKISMHPVDDDSDNYNYNYCFCCCCYCYILLVLVSRSDPSFLVHV